MATILRKDKSTACWIDEIGMAQVVENKGKMWRTMGIVRGGKIYYSIEETLYVKCRFFNLLLPFFKNQIVYFADNLKTGMLSL